MFKLIFFLNIKLINSLILASIISLIKDILIFLKVDDLKNSFYTLSFEQQFFVAIFSQSYINLFKEKAATAILFADYSPPFLKQDILVLHQIFLI